VTEGRSIDVAEYRTVAGHFATGVAVVTAVDDDDPVGFTCQAFASLSLDPPLILVCGGNTSVSYARVRRCGDLCVNVLSEEQEALARSFAQSTVDKFTGLGYRPAPNGAPVLEGGLAWLAATMEAEYDGGDHRIAVCRVTAIGSGSGRSPLIFYRGGFGTFRS
jgi:3-hydroxy-9,10-secoandrosta-1,3,5(10)-triene-9,17-dione monooxygenase reductase component